MDSENITITINDVSTVLPSGSTLPDAITRLQLTDTRGMAVAVNGKVIPRPQWQQNKLRSNDKVLIIRATQGG